AFRQALLDLQDDFAAGQLAGRQLRQRRLHLLRRVDGLALRVFLVASKDLDRECLLRRLAAEVADPELHGPRLILLDRAGLDPPRRQRQLGIGGGPGDERQRDEPEESGRRRAAPDYLAGGEGRG